MHTHMRVCVMQTVERGSRDELAQWGALADEYQQRLDAVQGSLAQQQQQATQFRAENQQLRTHNGQLLEYGQRLRAQLQALHEEERAHAFPGSSDVKGESVSVVVDVLPLQ